MRAAEISVKEQAVTKPEAKGPSTFFKSEMLVAENKPALRINKM